MDLGEYRSIKPISSGRDGSCYRTQAPNNHGVVLIHVLTGAKSDADRWQGLLSRLRTASLITHPSALKIFELNLKQPVPTLVVEDLEARSLVERFATGPAMGRSDRVELASRLAEAVDAGHRLGLAHGRLEPAALLISPERGLLLDWTGVETDASRLAESESAANACRPPGIDREASPTLEADRYALGVLIAWIVTGRFPSEDHIGVVHELPGLAELVADLMTPIAADRATAWEALQRLAEWGPRAWATIEATPRTQDSVVATQAQTIPAPNVTVDLVLAELPAAHSNEVPPGAQSMLGRFRLMEKLGQGGMGSVFRAEDLSDGTIVAIKVLIPGRAQKPDEVKRFLKEARMLSEIKSPFITNFIEVNHDQGVHFIVLEYVAGCDLTKWLRSHGRMEERTAVAVAADIARALGVAHKRGIVHRDIKPENILIVEEMLGTDQALKVKLSDFGIAKALEREESAITQLGTILGTPLYMSPEQCAGGALGPWSDVYSLGATLFHLLSGRPPFLAETVVGLIHQHQNEPAPPLRSLDAQVSEAVDQVVMKCLAKRKEERYPDASSLLADLERILRGEPTAIAIHPLLPATHHGDVIAYDWNWRLQSPPDRLWPHVSNTERLNRAVGIPAVAFRDEVVEGGVNERFGAIRKAGVEVAWKEYPFEWVEGRRMGVFREYTKGPFDWFASIVELEPTAAGGTILTHRVRIAPKGLLGRGIAAVEIGVRGRKAVEAVYARIDAAVSGQLGKGADADPFESPTVLMGEPRRRLDAWMRELGRAGLDPTVIESLGDYLARGPIQEVARIRPLALSRRLGLDPAEVINACLIGASEGVLILLWDLICPICRVPSQVLDSLRELDDHGECPACRTEFPLDFAQSVEMIFRLHPSIRQTEVGTYCLGGPANAPHVVAQVRVAPGEPLSLQLALNEGHYRLRGPQVSFQFDFQVEADASDTGWELDLGKGPEIHLANRLRTGGVVLNLFNPFDREVLVRVERVAPRADALTAARVSALPLFRALFPGEVLKPGRLVRLATIALLVTELPDARSLYAELGDAAAFARIHEHFRKLEEIARREGGVLVKTVGEGMILVFDDARSALRAALAIPGELLADPATSDLQPRISIHRGPAMVATLNSHLDYFGATVRLALALPGWARPGGVALTSSLAADPLINELIRGSGRKASLLPAEIPELGVDFLYAIEPQLLADPASPLSPASIASTLASERDFAESPGRD